MPITVLQGDIFTSTAQTLTCPVNTQGIMGAGLAKAFSQKYPDLLPLYKQRCKDRSLTVVKPTTVPLSEGKQCLLWATKSFWQNPSRLPWIRDALPVVILLIHAGVITSLALPAIGCGLGELRFENVLPLLMTLDNLPIPIEIYEPKI